MIAKMMSNLSAKDTLLYNDREKSEIIFIKNLTGENVHDVEKQMNARQKLFEGRAKNLTAHIIISPSPEDGKKQTLLDWKAIGNSFLKKAGLTSYQSIAYLHKDKEHFHLHIVVNRIDSSGKIFRHKNELAMSQRLGDEIAEERGLTRAAEIRRERKILREKGIKINPEAGIVAQIRSVLTESAKSARSGPQFNQEKYFENIKAKGFEVELFLKKDSNELRGYAVGKKGERLINASQIGSEFTLRKLTQETESHKPSAENFKDKIRKDVEANFQIIQNTGKHFEPQLFLNALRACGYTIKEYHNKDTGKLRGYGFELEGEIVNASEIGSDLTLTNLQKRFDELNQVSKRLNASYDATESKSESTAHHVEEEEEVQAEEISKELKRTIDIQLLSAVLRDLTSGHRYRSQDDFIKAIENKGYHVHLRYNQGKLSGYTIHNGLEHYHDFEIGKGKFQLMNLIKNGTILDLQSETPTSSVPSSENKSDLGQRKFGATRLKL